MTTAVKVHRIPPKAFWAIVIAIGLAVPLCEHRIALSETPSVNHRFFWVVGGQGQKGDYVTVKVAHPQMKDGTEQQLTKHISCVAGDVLTFDGKNHFCNGVKLGAVLDHDSKGRKMIPFVWDGTIPEGMAFLSGDHERSFDSRYFGFVKIADTKKLVAIW